MTKKVSFNVEKYGLPAVLGKSKTVVLRNLRKEARWWADDAARKLGLLAQDLRREFLERTAIKWAKAEAKISKGKQKTLTRVLREVARTVRTLESLEKRMVKLKRSIKVR